MTNHNMEKETINIQFDVFVNKCNSCGMDFSVMAIITKKINMTKKEYRIFIKKLNTAICAEQKLKKTQYIKNLNLIS